MLKSHGPTKLSYVLNILQLGLGVAYTLKPDSNPLWGGLWIGFWGGILLHTLTLHRHLVKMADSWEKSFYEVIDKSTENYIDQGRKIIKLDEDFKYIFSLLIGYIKELLNKYPEMVRHQSTLRLIEKLKNAGMHLFVDVKEVSYDEIRVTDKEVN